MTLYEKITQIYPELRFEDFHVIGGTITLQNDSDGRGDYIAKWEHSTLAKPTEEQLALQTQSADNPPQGETP
jgi:hypothetical protein